MPDPQLTYERKKRWREANPEKARLSVESFYARNPHARADKHLRKKYGISMEEYYALIAAQSGMCAICSSDTGRRLTRSGKEGMFVVDHCHTSGKVRGLLCHPCNTALGMVQDDVSVLKAMVKYIEANQ